MDKKTTKHRIYSYRMIILPWIVSALVFLSYSHALWALCTFAPSRSTINATLPISGTYTLPRNAPINQEIARFSWTAPNAGATVLNCSSSSIRNYTLPVLPYPTPVSAGVYPTNIAGVGVQILNNRGAAFPSQLAITSGAYTYPTDPFVVYRLIVTGPVSPGTITSSNLPQARMTIDGSPVIYNLTTSGSVTIVAQSCTTPNVLVNLGIHSISEFPPTAGPINTTPVSFNIQLNSCSPGMSSIKYTIDATTPITNPSQGVVALNSGSTANGIGVRVTDSNNIRIQYGTPYTLSSYLTAGGNYTIPLKAAYYRTGTAPIQPGSANTSLTFTMLYQ